VPKPYPKEFGEDVVAVARGREPGVTIEQIAKDFGVHAMTLQKWLQRSAIDEGAKPGQSRAEGVELPEARKRIRFLSRRTRCCGGRQRIYRQRICREKVLPARD